MKSLCFGGSQIIQCLATEVFYNLTNYGFKDCQTLSSKSEMRLTSVNLFEDKTN